MPKIVTSEDLQKYAAVISANNEVVLTLERLARAVELAGAILTTWLNRLPAIKYEMVVRNGVRALQEGF